MKTILFLFLVNICSLTAHSQTSERFNFRTSGANNTRYTISLKTEKSISPESRAAGGRFITGRSQQEFRDSLFSIVEKFIPAERMQKINTGIFIGVDFSLTGEALRVRMHIQKEAMRKLSLDEDDLYALFQNLLNMEIDMSTYEITWTQSSEDFLVFAYRINLRPRK